MRRASRYGLRPSRLALRDQNTTEAVNAPGQDLHLSTAGDQKAGLRSWLNIGSARWRRFGSAPTVVDLLARMVGIHQPRHAPNESRLRFAVRIAPSPAKPKISK